MSLSITGICNLALSNLGEGASIGDFNEVSVLAAKCRGHYDIERQALLSSHLWRFAKKRATLSALGTAPAFGWAFAYSLPNNCLRVWTLNGDEARMPDAEWEIEGQAILTDATVADIVYIQDLTDVTLFPPLFVKAFALSLAASICVEITNSADAKAALLNEFQAITQAAGWKDAVESKPRVIPVTHGSRILAARFGGCR